MGKFSDCRRVVIKHTQKIIATIGIIKHVIRQINGKHNDECQTQRPRTRHAKPKKRIEHRRTQTNQMIRLTINKTYDFFYAVGFGKFRKNNGLLRHNRLICAPRISQARMAKRKTCSSGKARHTHMRFQTILSKIPCCRGKNIPALTITLKHIVTRTCWGEQNGLCTMFFGKHISTGNRFFKRLTSLNGTH